jgi:hypothetical protein
MTRKELTEASLRILSTNNKNSNNLPKWIGEINTWKMAIIEVFEQNLTGPDVEIVREGWKQFVKDGEID